MSADRESLGIVIVGHGRMGRAVERVAIRRGHAVARIVGSGEDADALSPSALAGADVAIEFTRAESAPSTIERLLAAGVATVSGTTGWDEGIDAARARSRETGTPFLWAPNFSVGIQVMSRLVALAAEAFGAAGGFGAWLHEAHHAGKRDAPSGTARSLAARIVDASPSLDASGTAEPGAPIDPRRLCVSWTRAGEIPGTHEAGWDGPFETLRIEHVARDRTVFAEGAVRAAEWLVGRRGPHSFEEMIASLLSGRGGAGR